MEYSCAICGTAFKSFNPRPQFCSRECKSKSQMADVPVLQIVKVYLGGSTIEETAKAIGTTIKIVANTLKRQNVRRRKAVKRNQSGSSNAYWQGDQATYAALHKRVEVARGKPSQCEQCKASGSGRYEWSNQTGNYTDVSDYVRLCVSCHRIYDGKRRKETGKRTVNVPRTRKGVAS